MPILSAKFLRIQSRCSFDSHSDCASSRRSSCLRSSNRSVRKSFPSQVNKSNAKKHGGFPHAGALLQRVKQVPHVFLVVVQVFFQFPWRVFWSNQVQELRLTVLRAKDALRHQE